MKHLGLTVILITVLFWAGCAGALPHPETATKEPTETTAPKASRTQHESRQVPELAQPGESLSLSNVIAFALAENPDLKSAQARLTAAGYKIKRVSGYPDPRIGVTYPFQEIETRNGPIEGGITASQKIPWSGKLDTRGKLAESEANILKQDYDALRLSLIYQVKAAYFDFYWFSRAISLTKTNLELLKGFEKVAQVKYKTNQLPQANLLKVQLLIAKLRNDLSELVRLNQTAMSKLNTLLNRPIDAPLSHPDSLKFGEMTTDLSGLYARAEQSSPQLKRQRELITKGEIETKLAKLDYYPDFNLGLQYQLIGTGAPMGPDEGQDALAAMFSINLPIWRGKLKAAVRETETRTRAERFALSQTENRIRFNIKDSYLKLITAQHQAVLYRSSIVPLSKQIIRNNYKHYQVDEIGFLELVNSQRTFLSIQLGYERVLLGFHKHLAELELSVGAELSVDKTE